MMMLQLKTLVFSIFVLLLGCTPNREVSVERVQTARRDVRASSLAFEQIADIFLSNSITWANRTSVRYKIGDEYRTEDWAVAPFSAAAKSDLLQFVTSHNVDAIFVHKARVNFVLHASGIGPSGVAVGVVIAPDDQHGCTEINAPLKLNARGMQCEKLNGLAYFYLDR